MKQLKDSLGAWHMSCILSGMSKQTSASKTHVTCPECDHAFARTTSEPGKVLHCTRCNSRFRISARETVLHLDRVPAGHGSADSWSELRDYVGERKFWFIALLLICFAVPGLIPIILLVGGILLFSDRSAEDRAPVSTPTLARAEEPSATPRAPRTSLLAIFSLLVGSGLLMGGVSLALMGGEIQQGMLSLSTSEMSGVLVAISAGLIPGLIGIFLASSARRRCLDRQLQGRGMATCALLMSLIFLGSLGHTFYRSFDQLTRWRAIEQLASRQDSQTLDALATEIAHPASPGARRQAARLLVTHAPERAVAMLEHARPATCQVVLRSLAHSPDRRLALPAAQRIIKLRPNSREAEIARRLISPKKHKRSHGSRRKQKREARACANCAAAAR